MSLTFGKATDDGDDAKDTPAKKKATPRKKVGDKKVSSADAEDGEDKAAVKDEADEE